MPNPKLKLLEQASEVMRFKHYSLRTERTYQEWIGRFILDRICSDACGQTAN